VLPKRSIVERTFGWTKSVVHSGSDLSHIRLVHTLRILTPCTLALNKHMVYSNVQVRRRVLLLARGFVTVTTLGGLGLDRDQIRPMPQS